MRAFKVQLNDKDLYTAGVGENGVLTAIIGWVRRDNPVEKRRKSKGDLFLDVGGLASQSGEHLSWRRRSLRVGDEIIVRIVETDAISKPSRRSRNDPAMDIQAQKRHLRKMAKKYGWKIVTRL